MTPPWETVHHLCIAVHDIDAAVAFYESIGIGPWHDYPPLREFVELDVPDETAFFELSYRYAELGQLQLQLVQPGPSDSPQRRFLDAHGEGVFHIGFEVADANAAEARATALGLHAWARGRRTDGSGFTYYETSDRAGGVTLETRQGRTPA